MRPISVLPNVITAFGLSCGLFVIFKMNMTPIGQASVEVVLAVTGILLLGALADLLDGAVARVMNAESEFGGIFDSLADAITFGVAPSVVVLKSLSLAPGSRMSFLATSGAMIFSVCGILRLARFGVLANQLKGDDSVEKSFKKTFTGLPIPAAALAAISMNLMLISEEFRFCCELSEKAHAIILFFTMVILGYFMVSRWKFPSFKSLNWQVSSFRVVFMTVIATVCLFYGILHHFVVVFFCLSWLYIVVAWVLSIIRIMAGKKSSTLKEFEPEEETHIDIV